MKFSHVFKIAVDRSETDESDGIVLLQALHDLLADFGGRALAVRRVDDEGLHLVHQLLHLAHRDGTLLAGAQQSGEDFLAVKLFAPAVFLDDHVGDLVDAFVGSEAPLTFHALATAANRLALFALARVYYFVIQESAKRALHRKLGQSANWFKSWVIPDCNRLQIDARTGASRRRSTIAGMRKRSFGGCFLLLTGDGKASQRDVLALGEDESRRNNRHKCDQLQQHAATYRKFRRVAVTEGLAEHGNRRQLRAPTNQRKLKYASSDAGKHEQDDLREVDVLQASDGGIGLRHLAVSDGDQYPYQYRNYRQLHQRADIVNGPQSLTESEDSILEYSPKGSREDRESPAEPRGDARSTRPQRPDQHHKCDECRSDYVSDFAPGIVFVEITKRPRD